MDRRKYLKTIVLGGLIPSLCPTLYSCASSKTWQYKKGVTYKSDWANWPDMKWVGPIYWGNRLQDWIIKDGSVICDFTGKNRNLHLLPIQKPEGLIAFTTSVYVEVLNDEIKNLSKVCIGLRLGAKGPYEDYRSAAVFGKGFDVGLTNNGNLKVGQEIYKTKLTKIPKKYQLVIEATPNSTNYQLKVSVINTITNEYFLKEKEFIVEDKNLTGNFSILADVPGKLKENIATKQAAKFSDWAITSEDLKFEENHFFGPINFAQYTLHKNKLKLTAQLSPIENIIGHKVELQFKRNNSWNTLQTKTITSEGRAINFSIENWNSKSDIPYKIVVTLPLKKGVETFEFIGTIATEPIKEESIKAAVFSCNAHYGFPDADVYESVSKLQPDIIMFLGDQFYEGTGGFGAQYTGDYDKRCLDYLRKWYMFGWSYREIFRHKPCAIIPDDHDMYHGNIWGESGKKADNSKGFGAFSQDSGGYKMSADWVNMVQFTQTSHLPDPYDNTPVKQNISVYYTKWNYAGISFAILEDRKFKSSPLHVLPKEAQVKNGWIMSDDFDIKNYKNLEAELLGKRQEEFLENWVEDWSDDTEMKAVLSQTNFATVATLPKGSKTGAVIPSLKIPEKGEYIKGDRATVDMDSNGWPSKKRDKAVEIIRKGFAFHIAGDQHLASFIQYGLDEHADSGFAFAGPAINNLWPRRFWPNVDSTNHTIENPVYKGNHFDGFGNKMSVLAVANPQNINKEPKVLHNRAVGFGLVTFNKKERTIKTECWPRFVDPTEKNSQYPGWPITIAQKDNYARKAKAYLPEIKFKNINKPVVKIINEELNELVYSLNINENTFKPKVFDDVATYTIKVGDSDKNIWKEKNKVHVSNSEIVFEF